MKFKAFDKSTKKYVDHVVITKDGEAMVYRGDEELNSIINEYYRKKGDPMFGDYKELDFTDWYASENIIIEWYDNDGNRLE